MTVSLEEARLQTGTELLPKCTVLHLNTYDRKSPKYLRVQTKRIVTVKFIVAIRATCECVVEIDLRNAPDAV